MCGLEDFIAQYGSLPRDHEHLTQKSKAKNK